MEHVFKLKEIVSESQLIPSYIDATKKVWLIVANYENIDDRILTCEFENIERPYIPNKILKYEATLLRYQWKHDCAENKLPAPQEGSEYRIFYYQDGLLTMDCTLIYDHQNEISYNFKSSLEVNGSCAQIPSRIITIPKSSFVIRYTAIGEIFSRIIIPY